MFNALGNLDGFSVSLDAVSHLLHLLSVEVMSFANVHLAGLRTVIKWFSKFPTPKWTQMGEIDSDICGLDYPVILDLLELLEQDIETTL